jgi:hypothetical protein
MSPCRGDVQRRAAVFTPEVDVGAGIDQQPGDLKSTRGTLGGEPQGRIPTVAVLSTAIPKIDVDSRA